MKPMDFVGQFCTDMLVFMLIFGVVVALGTAFTGGRPISGLVIKPQEHSLLIGTPEPRQRAAVVRPPLRAESNRGPQWQGSFPLVDPRLDARRTRNPPLLL